MVLIQHCFIAKLHLVELMMIVLVSFMAILWLETHPTPCYTNRVCLRCSFSRFLSLHAHTCMCTQAQMCVHVCACVCTCTDARNTSTLGGTHPYWMQFARSNVSHPTRQSLSIADKKQHICVDEHTHCISWEFWLGWPARTAILPRGH